MRRLVLLVIACAGCLAPMALAPAAPGPRPVAGTAQAPAPECRTGSDGQQVCGYNCRLGADGHFSCGASPDDVCTLDSDGAVVCSKVVHAMAGGSECRTGSDGSQTCGYNCRLGSNGRWYCASKPYAACALLADGTWECP